MEVRIEDIGPCKKCLSIKVPPERIREEIEKNLAELTATVQFPGFRPGKAPRNLVEKRFKSTVVDEVKEKLVRESLGEALTENSIDVIGSPELDKVEMEEESGLSYEATVEVRPEIKLEDYKGVELKKAPTEPTSEEIDEFILSMRRRYGTMQDVRDGKVVEDAWVRADSEIFVADERVWKREGIVFGVEEGLILGLAVEGLKDKVLGAAIGDELEFDVTLPEGFFIEEHRGKQARLKVKITEVRRLVPAELTETLLERLGVSSEEDLRARVAGELRSSKEAQAREDMSRQLREKLLDAAEAELPEDLVNRVAADIAERRKRWMRLASGAEAAGSAEEPEDLASESMEAAREQVIWHFLLEDVAEKEKIFATEDDVDQELELIAVQSRKRPTAVRTELERSGRLSELRSEIRRAKTVQFLLDNAKIEESG